MKYQYIYQFLAQLVRKHNEFMNYKSMLTKKDRENIQKYLSKTVKDLNNQEYSKNYRLKFNSDYAALKAKIAWAAREEAVQLSSNTADQKTIPTAIATPVVPIVKPVKISVIKLRSQTTLRQQLRGKLYSWQMKKIAELAKRRNSISMINKNIRDLFVLTMPYNLELINLLSKLKNLGFLSYTIHVRTVVIVINLFSYSKIVVHSKPSRQIFKRGGKNIKDNSYFSIWTKDSGFGLSILRTSKGFLTSIEAKQLHIGGELLFSIL